VLVATTTLPFAVHMSGWIYLISALALGSVFLYYAWQLHRHYNDQMARKTFAFSILYLSLLFAALLVDHYLKF
jgi:protoheme IX farnesyltransferase